ncbi:MAG: Spermidine synthase [Cyanobacteria bacterium RYN_339]|nr:Spermidine synthase [Cyanobacteria bacterium RYN_339]
MTNHHRLQAASDGSVALYIGGDLQFDSRDEQIYHEVLALPALAIALAAVPTPLNVLVCGGGDGLALRELLKAERVAHVDLVDYDPGVVALARTELAELNGRSLADPRVSVHVGDARAFVEACTGRYDVIISDLTWPKTPTDAGFHTVGWYARLASALTPGGVLSLNAASPSATPEAYWAMVNGLRHAGLHARPLRFALPSFQAQGYGPDWGMIVASPAPLPSFDVALPGPRRALRDAAQLRRLAFFPADHERLAKETAPCDDGAVLFTLLQRPGPVGEPDAAWDTLAAELGAGTGPVPAGLALVPAPIRTALAEARLDQADQETLVERVLDLMPGLQREPTRTMVASFLEAPARFLAAVDLPGLVDRLLARAKELPALFVGELQLLKQTLAEPGPALEHIARVGARVLAVVMVVVVVGNLAFPDSVFGKGASAGGHAGSFLHAGRSSSSTFEPPSIASHGGFRTSSYGRGHAVDEMGYVVNVPHYRVYHTHYYGGGTYHSGSGSGTNPGVGSGDTFGEPEDLQVVYRLTPEVGLTEKGQLVMDLNDKAFFVIDKGPMTLFDRDSGQPVLSVAQQPLLMWRLAHELDRQRKGLVATGDAKDRWIYWMDWLSFMPGSADDVAEATNVRTMAKRLETATFKLPSQPTTTPATARAPTPGAQELFNGAWIMINGNALAIETEQGSYVYLDPVRGFFQNEQLTMPAALPYTPALRDVITHHLAQQTKDEQATRAGLTKSLQDYQADLSSLRADIAEYTSIGQSDGMGSSVTYGTQNVSCATALQLSNDALNRAQATYNDIYGQIGKLPSTMATYRQLQERFMHAGGKP